MTEHVEAASLLQRSSADERRESFYDRFVHDPWCDLDERPKLRKAIDTLIERVPEDVIDDLPYTLLLAPSPWQLGAAMYAPRMPEDDVLIYLSPELEGDLRSQSESDFTLAHEVAHVCLGHHRADSMLSGTPRPAMPCWQIPHEQEADALVKRWGYEIPARRRGDVRKREGAVSRVGNRKKLIMEKGQSCGGGTVLAVDMSESLPTVYIRTGDGRLVKCADMPFPVKENDRVRVVQFEDGTAGVGETGGKLGMAEFIEDLPDHV